MKLYKLNNKKINSIRSIPFSLEKDIQNIVENNTMDFFNLKFVCSEFTVGDFRIDSLCFDEETSSFVIIEYKKQKSYSVIDQGYSYLSLMLDNKSDFILEYNENQKNPLKKNDVDWSQSRIIFVSPSFSTYQKQCINFQDIPFELYEIEQYENNMISLNKILSKSSESIKKLSKQDKRIEKVGSEIKTYDESYHLKKCNDNISSLYQDLKNRLEEFDELEIKIVKSYISIKRGNLVVCYLYPRKSFLLLSVIKGYKNYKSRFNLDDPKKIFIEKTMKDGKWGDLYLYEYELKDSSYIDYVIMMLKQKYDFLYN